MSTAACCPTDRTAAAASHESSARGKMEKLNSMDCYVVGSGSHTVVLVYDIFGFHSNNYELADSISQSLGWVVVIPDLFRGSPWPAVNFPPRGQDQASMFSRFLNSQADCGQRALDVKAVIDHYRSGVRQTFSIIAFCWGCKVAALVNDYPGVKSICGAHPSFLTASDGFAVNVPTLWLPTADDDISDYINGFTSARRDKFVTVSSDFSDLFHGFMAARGDWMNDKIRERVSYATKAFVDFIKNSLDF